MYKLKILKDWAKGGVNFNKGGPFLKKRRNLKRKNSFRGIIYLVRGSLGEIN